MPHSGSSYTKLACRPKQQVLGEEPAYARFGRASAGNLLRRLERVQRRVSLG